MIFSTCCKKQVELVVWDISYFPKNTFLTLSVKLPLPYTMFLNIGACHKFSFPMQSSHQTRSSNVVMLFPVPKANVEACNQIFLAWRKERLGMELFFRRGKLHCLSQVEESDENALFSLPDWNRREDLSKLGTTLNEVLMNSFRGTSLWVCLD